VNTSVRRSGADETRLRMQNDGTGKPKNGFVWTFVAADEHGDQDVAYIIAGDRSGETPKRILGGTKGTLIVDAYSGYNVVAEVSRRKRAACHAHLRRYFHEALPSAPIAQEAIDLILGIYRSSTTRRRRRSPARTLISGSDGSGLDRFETSCTHGYSIRSHGIHRRARSRRRYDTR